MRATYRNSADRDGIFGVLDATWPGMPQRIERARSLGWDWTRVTTPFVSRVDDTIVAHVGVLETTLWVEGRAVPIAGVHAVSCRPEHRSQGHMRRAMEAALRYVDDHRLPALLTCEVPAIYERFGFAAIPEHRSLLPRPSDPNPPALPPLQPLPTHPDSLAHLHRLLAHRSPVSDRFAMHDTGWVFGICEVFGHQGLQRLHTNADRSLVVVHAIQNEVLELHDIVSPEQPDLISLVRQIPGDYHTVRCHFPPDRLVNSPPAIAWEPMPADDVLMLRGHLPLPSSICLPSTARW